MRFALGMDNREIARALGRTDGATKVLLHRAIRQLEGIVAEHDQPTDGATADPVSRMSATDFESLLREALTPVEPPADLAQRMESTLVNLTELAQEELEAWELSAMRDPRNWVRPAAAGVVGAGAGTALVVLRVRGRHRARAEQQSANLLDLAERTIQDIAEEARRVLPDR